MSSHEADDPVRIPDQYRGACRAGGIGGGQPKRMGVGEQREAVLWAFEGAVVAE
ncbi:hypothetical protein LTR86_011226, partial [Recurvomyces mirabilis]